MYVRPGQNLVMYAYDQLMLKPNGPLSNCRHFLHFKQKHMRITCELIEFFFKSPCLIGLICLIGGQKEIL